MKKEKSEEKIKVLHKHPSKYKYIFYILFLFIGLINNLGYVLILTGSQQLTNKFENKNLVALYLTSLILFSSFTRFINSKFCIKITYTKRLFGLSMYFFIGYISLFMILNSNNKDNNNNNKIFLTFIPAIIMGTGTSFGESTMLGYIKNFPKDYLVGWGSGTGFAGFIGSFISLMCKLNDWELKYLYLFISPISIIYFILILITKRIKDNLDSKFNNNKLNIYDSKHNSINSNSVNAPIQIKNIENNNLNNIDVSKNKNLTIINFLISFNQGKRFIINLALVYFFNIFIYAGIAERVSIKKDKFNNNNNNPNEKNNYFHYALYEAFLFFYQIGVVISRSSLPIVKNINFIEIFVIIQIINTVFWLVEYYTFFIKNQYILFIHIIFVGIMSGSSYILCFYKIIKSEIIKPEYKELCLNISTMFNDFAILFSSIMIFIFDNTFMKYNE